MTAISFTGTGKHPTFDSTSIKCRESMKQGYLAGKRWCVYVFNHHTDLISNLGVLAATTMFLASKVFPNAPAFLPQIAIIILNRGVIIWVNEQVRDLYKSCRDFRLVTSGQWEALSTTAVKVSVKAVDLFLTCAMFAASCAIFFGLTGISTYIYTTMRPLALGSLVCGLSTKCYDYYVDKSVLKYLDQIDASQDTQQASQKIAKLMKCVLEVLVLPLEEQQALDTAQEERSFVEERSLARKIVRQFDLWTVQTFQDSLKEKKTLNNARMEAIKLFYSVKDSIVNRQAAIEANLSLMGLGYVAMAVSRAWPDTVADMSARWVMSVLYTDELVRQKLFQWDLAKTLAN